MRPMFDDSAFPIVHVYAALHPDGYAVEYCRGIDRLLDRGTPFAMISHGSHAHVSEEDTRTKAAWFKTSRDRFDQGVATWIYVETDPDLRTKMAADIARTASLFSHCRLAVAADEAQALAMARAALTGAA